MASGLKRCAG